MGVHWATGRVQLQRSVKMHKCLRQAPLVAVVQAHAAGKLCVLRLQLARRLKVCAGAGCVACALQLNPERVERLAQGRCTRHCPWTDLEPASLIRSAAPRPA